MGEKISMAKIARALDAILDDQMTAQARIAAHLVAAAEAAGHDSPHVIETLDAIISNTVLDEIWITDEQGVAYLTNVRDETGTLVSFRFDPDPAVQPQASAFYVLLASPLDSDDVITQPAVSTGIGLCRPRSWITSSLAPRRPGGRQRRSTAGCAAS